MARLSITDFKAKVADTINCVQYQGERVVLSRNNKDVVALVSIEDLTILEKLEDQIDALAADESLQDPRPSIPWQDVKAKLGL